ncbi:hypothetical protein RJT34_30022 [Clitoria ternatea]|uniref:Uncharacterized protein n=1 Tax=Clitoria ternatea TaxID=43366 RepID=A0AAN9I296_CLITE
MSPPFVPSFTHTSAANIALLVMLQSCVIVSAMLGSGRKQVMLNGGGHGKKDSMSYVCEDGWVIDEGEKGRKKVSGGGLVLPKMGSKANNSRRRVNAIGCRGCDWRVVVLMVVERI